MINIALVMIPLFFGYFLTDQKMKAEQNKQPARKVIAGINLTVAAGKRLIAEGLAFHPEVMAKIKSGLIIDN
jgi:hypothetical protein